MPFFLSRKKFEFEVEFTLQQLTAVPIVNSYIFAKLRLLSGGSFTKESNRERIHNCSVQWESTYKFHCKLSCHSGTLEPCKFRITIKKETKGGKSYEKLGYTEVDLAKYAGGGRTSLRFILDSHDVKRQRLANSILHVALELRLISGDICFKVPQPDPPLPLETEPEKAMVKYSPSTVEHQDHFKPGHSRDSSLTSQVSGYSSYHSRQSSTGSQHLRNPSGGSYNEMGVSPGTKHLEKKRKSLKKTSSLEAIDNTRHDADQTIREIIDSANLEEEGGQDLRLADFHIPDNNTPIVTCTLNSSPFILS